ncbi:MAG: hypothetical protein ACOYXO_03380 [Chloroflexota bacterium]
MDGVSPWTQVYHELLVCAHRCPVAEKGCAVDQPPLVEVDEDHWVACVHYESGADLVKPLSLAGQDTQTVV